LQPEKLAAYKQSFIDKLNANNGKAGNVSLKAHLRDSFSDDNITDDDYWLVRDALIDESLIERGGGKGGSARLLENRAVGQESLVPAQASTGPEAIEPIAITRESDLYEGFQNAIKEGYVKDRRIKRFVAQITATQGRRSTGGKWTRPDVTLIAMRTYSFIPGKRLEVITFEIKPSLDSAIEGIFEAKAHSALAHRCYLAVATTDEDEQHEDWKRIKSECQRLGIGLITFSEVSDWATFEIQVEAHLTEPDPYQVDDFIRKQIDVDGQDEIREWLR